MPSSLLSFVKGVTMLQIAAHRSLLSMFALLGSIVTMVPFARAIVLLDGGSMYLSLLMVAE
jgi:hypothetical protein